MDNTQLIAYSKRMAKSLRGKPNYEPYHNNEIALVLEELVKQLVSQHAKNKVTENKNDQNYNT